MLNEIIKGISMALNAAFGDGYEIFQNDVEQGLKEPCFFISVLKPEVIPMLGRRSIKRNPFVIQYFPIHVGDNMEMMETAETMMGSLTFIALPNGDYLRGSGISYEIVNGVLHFFVSYNLTMTDSIKKTPMDRLEQDIGTN